MPQGNLKKSNIKVYIKIKYNTLKLLMPRVSYLITEVF